MVKRSLVPFLIVVFLLSVFSSRGLGRTEADTHFQRGISHINNSQYQEAIREFNQALAIDSKYVDAYCGMGIAYLNQKKYKEAIETLEKAVALDPDKAIAYYLLGMAYEETMNYGAAVSTWTKFLTLSPEGKRADRVRRHLKRLEDLKE